MNEVTGVTAEEPQNPLESALLTAASNPSTRTGFYTELMRSDLFLVGRLESVTGKVREGAATPEPGDKLIVIPRDGDPRIHVFTSLVRLRTAIGEQQVPYVGLPADVLFAAIDPGEEIILNAGVWHGKVIVPTERRLLMEGHLPGSAQEVHLGKGIEVQLRAPAEYPDRLVAALRTHFDQSSVVVEARLAEIDAPLTGIPPHPVVGVRARSGPAALRSIFESLIPVVEGTLPDGVPVDFVDLEGVGVGDYLRAETEPFFTA